LELSFNAANSAIFLFQIFRTFFISQIKVFAKFFIFAMYKRTVSSLPKTQQIISAAFSFSEK